MKEKIEQTFETQVQGVFATPYGKSIFIQMAIMTEYFVNSLVATAKLRANTGCEHPNIYFNAQKDLASKYFNALTHQQFAELRQGVMEALCPPKPKPQTQGEK